MVRFLVFVGIQVDTCMCEWAGLFTFPDFDGDSLGRNWNHNDLYHRHVSKVENRNHNVINILMYCVQGNVLLWYLFQGSI